MKKSIVCCLLALLVLAGCTKTPDLPAAADSPASVVFATDLHYLAQSLTDNGEGYVARMYNGDGKALLYVDQIVDALVEQLATEQPAALVLGGDLTLNGEKESHRDLAKKLQKLEKAGVPVLVMPGNHDVNNFMSSGFREWERYGTDTVTRSEFERIYRDFGYSEAASRDKDSLSYIYPLRSDLWVLMLDVNESPQLGRVTDSTYQWLAQQLAAAQQQGVTVVAASHQNLLQHSPLFSSGYVIDDSDKLLELYRRYGVQLNLSGHIHLQHIAATEGLQEVVTTSLVVNPSRYGVVDFDGAQLRYTAKPVDVAGWAAKTNQQQPDLLGFPQFTRQLFWDIAYAQKLDYLLDWGIDKEHCDQMARFYADVNTDYFSGEPTARRRDDPAWALWTRYDSESRSYQYIESMLDSTATAHDSLTIAIG